MTSAAKKIISAAYSKSEFVIVLLLLWQFGSLLLAALGIWPENAVWASLVLVSAFVILFPVYDSLLLTAASIPFYTVLPNPSFDTFSMWRILFALLFASWLARSVFYPANFDLKRRLAEVAFMPWDRYLAGFFAVALLSIAWSRFPAEGVKQALFWANIYIVYLVIVNSVKDSKQAEKLAKFAAYGLLATVLLGYAQPVFAFFVGLDTFWVYWAENISRIYYGSSFMEVALYSNSWFNFTGGRSLRMFSIMPDSHSFGLVSVFALAFSASLAAALKKVSWVKNIFLLAMALSALALIYSGTRAVWAGMLLPLCVSLAAYFSAGFKKLAKRGLLALAFVAGAFLLAPLLNNSLSLLRPGGESADVLQRVRTIYDTAESSNALRLKMWKDSLFYAAARPWGTGADNFLVSLSENSQASSYNELAEKINEKYNLPQRFVTAHSLYLQMLVELGIAGLLFFCLFAIKYVREAASFLKKAAQDSFSENFVFLGLLAIFWVLAAAAFDVTLYNDRVLMYFFIILGLSGAIFRNAGSLKEP